MSASDLAKEKKVIRELSERIVVAQQPVRILDAIKWGDEIKQAFFASKFTVLPAVDEAYYQSRPLPFNSDDKIEEFRGINRDIKARLGNFHPLGNIMSGMCEDYIKACFMLAVRGTKQFSDLAMELYGSPDDAFYPNGPKLKDLSHVLADVLIELKAKNQTLADEKRYTAAEAVELLQERLKRYFVGDDKVHIVVDDNIVADAAAGSDTIKLNSHSMFSDRDIRYLEVHEGWVHVGTTINGMQQPVCTFLSKGSPAATLTQEGLAVTIEILTLSSNPQRVLKIVDRLTALDKANQGADFIEVFQFFREQGLDNDTSFSYAKRIFRGSTPDGKPFTKDLSYTKGFLLIYNYIRLAIQEGLEKYIPAMFAGKVLLKDLPVIYHSIEEGMITPPKYVPPQFADLAALSAWMSFSLFLNKLDLEQLANSFRNLLK